MKKHRPPQGMRIYARMLFYTLCFLAMIASREQWTSGGGPLTDSLGRGLNQILLASSKLGLGFALICGEESPADTLIGRGGRKLGRSAHKAFIEASKVELFAK
ncbi:MAG: hypothetical protein MUF86_15890 [Akkermansiaceae bacterium]|jgi:hypothetical protein|nr:hypothetical protein [Akkermansiaceae bacterium]